MKITARYLLPVLVSFCIMIGCSHKMASQKSVNKPFAKGADIGWLPQMEATGYKFYNDKGVEQDCIQILKDHGINTVRLRTWVNPSNDPASGHCSKDETVALAVRAQKAGMRIMIDFHYSDSWTDPGKQRKPKAWEGHSFPQLLKDLYDYTFDVMSALKAQGVTPEWVQVGNETPGGMLYPEGMTTHWDSLAQLINKGYDAIKAVSPASKVILHLDQGNNSERLRSWFDSATAHHAKYDVIGLSYIVLVGEILLAAIFLVAVVAGIRSLVWKAVWPVAAGCLWYFAGPFYAFPLMLAVVLRVATTVAASAQSLPAKDGVSPTA